MAALDVHHLGDGHTAGNPLFCGSLQVGNLGQVAGVTILDQHECIVAQAVAVVSIEVGGECAASFVAEEVVLCTELALVGTSLLTCIQIVLDQSREQLLGLDQRDLNITMGIALQEQLLLNALRQNCEDGKGLLGQTVFDEGMIRFSFRVITTCYFAALGLRNIVM